MPASANTPPNRPRGEWTKLAAAALGILLVYSIIVMRPVHQRQQADNSKLQALQTAIGDLQERKHSLAQSLTDAPAAPSSVDSAPPVLGSKLVSRSDGSPAQLCSKLLACVENAELRCIQVTHGSSEEGPTARGSSRGSQIQLELIGSFEQLSQLLLQLANELEQVSVHMLRMNNRGNGECTWQLGIELRGGLT